MALNSALHARERLGALEWLRIRSNVPEVGSGLRRELRIQFDMREVVLGRRKRSDPV